MLKERLVTPNSPELELVCRLYESAFPENERRPLIPFVENRNGRTEVLSLWDEDIFCGFIVLLSYKDIVHIIYFAIDDQLRGKGYGTQALKLLSELKPGCRIIADLEAVSPDAHNNDQRMSRINFYIRNGYALTEVNYRWEGENYEIYSLGGSITNKEFWEFWDSF